MRNIPGTVCLMSAMFILCGCMNQEAGSVNETIQENNERIGTTAETNSEITEVDDMDSARALLSEQWDIQQPGALPEGFSVQGYYVYDRNMVKRAAIRAERYDRGRRIQRHLAQRQQYAVERRRMGQRRHLLFHHG